ncbi:DUF5585 domain-containing protein [Thalassiella azotivora]
MPTPRTPRRRAAAPRRLVAVLVTAVLAVAGLVAVAPTAGAATPATPVFPRYIDAYAGWETESGCDPTAKPGALSLQALIHRTWGSRPGSNISRSCTASNSGHEEGRSIDWMTNARIPAQDAMADELITWLLATDQHGNPNAMARRLGVSYIIYDSMTFSLSRNGAYWREYSDCQRVRTGPEFDNICHRNHVHISLSWAGAHQQTTWYTLAGETREPCVTPPTPKAPPAPSTAALGYVPVQPHRVLDTRHGTGVDGACWVPGFGRVDVAVTGTGGVPASGVAAVVLNVTAANAAGALWVGAHAAGATYQGTSSLNSSAGGSVAALVTVPVGTGGEVSLRTGGARTDLVADVVGYHPADGSGARYTPLPASRALDATLAPGTWTAVPPGVPAGATAVSANATVVAPSESFLTLAPGTPGGAGPSTSSVNARSGTAVANRSLMGLSGDRLSVFSSARGRGVVDVTGYFAPGAGAGYRPLSPSRVVDSRDGTGGVPRLTAGTTRTVQLGGRGGVPTGASAAVVSLTLDGATTWTYATAWQAGRPQPPTSDVNVAPGLPAANMAVVPLDSQGRASIRLNEGSADVLVDVLGYFGAAS